MFAVMNLASYRKEHSLSQAKLAERMTAAGFPATQSLVSQWESGEVVIPPERCAQVEQVTGGAVRREDLRPDIFGPLPVMTAPANAEPVQGVA